VIVRERNVRGKRVREKQITDIAAVAWVGNGQRDASRWHESIQAEYTKDGEIDRVPDFQGFGERLTGP